MFCRVKHWKSAEKLIFFVTRCKNSSVNKQTIKSKERGSNSLFKNYNLNWTWLLWYFLSFTFDVFGVGDLLEREKNCISVENRGWVFLMWWKKSANIGENRVGGWFFGNCNFFQHMFRKFFLDPPLKHTVFCFISVLYILRYLLYLYLYFYITTFFF